MLDEETNCFYCNDGREVNLGKTGGALLSVLIENKHRIVPREELVKEIWNEEYNGWASNKLNVLVYTINKKIKGTAKIKCKRGFGYIIV